MNKSIVSTFLNVNNFASDQMFVETYPTNPIDYHPSHQTGFWSTSWIGPHEKKNVN